MRTSMGLVLLLLTACGSSPAPSSGDFDFVLLGGRIVDGTGAAGSMATWASAAIASPASRGGGFLGLGAIPLQKLTSVELENYYRTKREGDKPLAEATLQLHHAVIHRALAAAERKRFVERNQARLVEGKP